MMVKVTFFLDWMTQVKKIAELTQLLKVQLAWAKAEGVVCKCTADMPSLSTWHAMKKRLFQVFSPVPTKSACNY